VRHWLHRFVAAPLGGVSMKFSAHDAGRSAIRLLMASSALAMVVAGGALAQATAPSGAKMMVDDLKRDEMQFDRSVGGGVAGQTSLSDIQTTGKPGSLAATTTIDGRQIPAPPQRFGGKIEKEATKSTPYWPARIVPPKGAPNVLLIMTDDAGYGVASTFGGVIPTPNLERIAQQGLRYTNFHSTSLCSPTKEMQALFWKGADKYQVKPLDASVVSRLIAPRPSLSAERGSFAWTQPISGSPNGDAPSLLNTSYTFRADIDVPQGGAEGMLITQGGRFSGYGFYLLKSKPVFLWNLVDLNRVRWEGPELSPGRHTIEFDFKYDGMGAATMAFGSYAGIGQGGTGVLKVDGTEVATQKTPHTIPFILAWDVPFAFTGKIKSA
jgi:hypothetical protein